MRVRLLLPLLLLALAPSALAQTGGAEAGVDPAYSSAASGGISVKTLASGFVGRRKLFSGQARAGKLVTIERFDDLQGGWSAVAHATADKDGAFTARWNADRRTGLNRFRARVKTSGARSASAPPEVAITLYSPSKATWYGPGFYGKETACRKTMSETLVGVAHRTLPCGTKVTFLYKGRTITAPVVDRGPFANGAKWDLTYAAAQQLGFEYTDTVGALASG